MDMQNVSDLQIPEGAVRAIHDKDNRLIWGRLSYDTKYAGNILQNGTPTPDTPIPVQTVTGEQTVKVTGKNMAQTTDCNISGTNYSMSISKGSVELRSQATNVCFDLNAGTRLGAWMPNYASAPDHHLTGNGGTYIVSFHDTSTSGLNSNTIVGVFTNKRNNSITINSTLPLRNINISLDSDEYVKAILYWIGSGTTDCTIKFKVQLEQGFTSSSYESYQSKTCQLSLGSTELCEVGDYQDYIYNSGNDWYVHKEVRHLQLAISDMDNSEDYPGWTGQTQFKADLGTSTGGSVYTDTDMVTNIAGLVTTDSRSVNKNFNGTNATIVLSRSYYGDDYTQTYWQSNYSSLVVDFYYGINVLPADIQITDVTLIGQLNTVHEWLTRYGYNATVTGNLPIIIDRTNL